MLGGGHKRFQQFAQLGRQVEHVARGAIQLLDDLIHGNLVAQGQRHQTAGGGPHGGLVLEIDPVVKGKLGKDLHWFLVLVKADDQVDGLLVDVLEPVTFGAEHIRQGGLLHQPLGRGHGRFVRA